MKVVIIEDEDLAAEFLEKLLVKSPFDVDVVQILDSKAQAIAWLKSNSCDLIFSDIHLGDGMSFEVFDSLSIKTPIIFTTAFDEYAIRSFEYFAIDYLLKPYNREKLNLALEKYANLAISTVNQTSNIEKLLIQFGKGQQQTNHQDRFMVSKGDQLISLNSSDIACFMADGKYLFIYTMTGESFLYEDTISDLEKRLSAKSFFKINRKYIVNHAAINKISKFSRSRINIELKVSVLNKEPILVSSKNVNAFKNWLNGLS